LKLPYDEFIRTNPGMCS
jgi:hypothetical protein